MTNCTDTYKDSGIKWIGKIPEEWNVVQVKSIFNIGRGRVISQLELDDNGEYPVYSSQTQNNGCLGYIKTYDFDVSQLTWTTDGANAGTVFLREGKHNCTNVCGTLQPKNDNVCLNYMLYNLLHTAHYHKRQDTNGYKIMNNEMAAIKICMPKLEEQQKIANYLDKKCGEIDRVVETEKSVIEKLKEYKQSIITEAVTKGLDKSVPLKDSGIEWIGKIPQHWEDIKLKFCTYIRARLGWKGLKAEEYVEEGYPLLSAFNIVNSKLIFEDLNFINQFRYDESPEIKLQEQDILLVKDGAGIGKCAIVENMPIPSTVNGSIAVITTNDLLMGKFLYYYFLSDLFQAYIDRLKDGMGVPHLFQSDLKEITIVIPNISEQEQIAEYLDKKCSEIDRAIADKEQVIEKFTEYKKSLIYECVTGKKRVS